MIIVDASDGETDVNRVRVVVGGEVDANGNRIVSSEQTTVVTSTSIVETETYIVLADPLDDDSVSSFVRPSVCHDPASVQDPDLIRNLDRLPDLVCLRVFEGAGDLPYRFYSLEALQSGPTLMVLQDGDDLAFDTAIRLLGNHGGRLVVFESDEQSRTTLTGANLELMTVSPYSMQGCGWAASELQLAYALHDYVVAVDVAVVSVRSGATGLDALDLFANGSSRLDLQSGSAAREIFQPVSTTLAPGAFLELMVTAATRRSQETRAIVQGALVNNLPTALTQVNLLSDADRCGLEMLAQQTDQPVARLLTGTTSTARALEVGAAMVRAMRLAQQSAGLESGLSSDATFDRLRAGQMETDADEAEALARLTAPSTPAGIDALAPVAVFGQDAAGGTTAMVVGDASYDEEMIGTSGIFPPAPKARLATSVRQILIPDGVDAAFIHDWIQPRGERPCVRDDFYGLPQLWRGQRPDAVPGPSAPPSTRTGSDTDEREWAVRPAGLCHRREPRHRRPRLRGLCPGWCAGSGDRPEWERAVRAARAPERAGAGLRVCHRRSDRARGRQPARSAVL